VDVIGAFIADTTCRELVYELGHKSPTKASELLDIATNFTTGEEAVGAIFPDAKGKQSCPYHHWATSPIVFDEMLKKPCPYHQRNTPWRNAP
jgi:hypothetical protein